MSKLKNRYLVLANPHSGRRRSAAALETIETAVKAQGYELDIRLTEYANHAREIARETCLDGYAGLCLFGGDGTFHEVVSGLMERDGEIPIPIGIIPGGTGNDVVRHLGIQDVRDGIQRVLAGRTRPFDVANAKFAGQAEYCTALVGWNAVAEVNRVAERLRWIGPARYAVAGLLQVVLAKRRPAKLVLDDAEFTDAFLLVTACNTPFIGGGMRFAPRAATDDGMLDVVVVRQATRWQLLRLFLKIFAGTHVAMDSVEYYQTSSLQILADDSLPLDIDGEVKGTTPVSIQIIPSALQIFV